MYNINRERGDFVENIKFDYITSDEDLLKKQTLRLKKELKFETILVSLIVFGAGFIAGAFENFNPEVLATYELMNIWSAAFIGTKMFNDYEKLKVLEKQTYNNSR